MKQTQLQQQCQTSPSSHKLSLLAAVLININIMLGSGIFINTVLLAKNTGPFGALAYLLVGVMLLPLIFSFAHLLRIREGGSFYDFGNLAHPLVGFVASFSYIVAKLSSAALGIHVFVMFMQAAFPVISVVPALSLELVIITLFVALNMLNIRTGQTIQYGFLMLKITPIVFAIIVGSYLFDSSHFNVAFETLQKTFSSVPFVLYAFAGFEACCSISKNIHNSERNAPRAVLISYSIGVCLAILYQACFYGALGAQLGNLAGYAQAFPALIQAAWPSAVGRGQLLIKLLSIGIASSSLGAAYGIIYSNVWNIHQLAMHNYIPGASILSRLNKNNIPYYAIILEGLVAACYLIISGGNQVPLQQINSLGMTLTYTVCVVALAIYQYRSHNRRYSKIHPLTILALASCCLLILSFARNATLYSPLPFIIFASILTLGIINYSIRK